MFRPNCTVRPLIVAFMTWSWRGLTENTLSIPFAVVVPAWTTVFAAPLPVIETPSTTSRSPVREASSFVPPELAWVRVSGVPSSAGSKTIESVPGFAFEYRIASRSEQVPVPLEAQPLFVSAAVFTVIVALGMAIETTGSARPRRRSTRPSSGIAPRRIGRAATGSSPGSSETTRRSSVRAGSPPSGLGGKTT